ncbi:hypothetical protein AB0F72_38600 [Actinoplanes sp. NPDC023936]|uniref:hypothetical protein n=1 Tax=Actinoplanes sp. NPDC023936 TaxID=3154910 RepID=UPI0033D30C56
METISIGVWSWLTRHEREARFAFLDGARLLMRELVKRPLAGYPEHRQSGSRAHVRQAVLREHAGAVASDPEPADLDIGKRRMKQRADPGGFVALAVGGGGLQ